MDVKHLVPFQVCVRETDLMIFADRNLTREALQSVHQFRSQIENYILQHPEFKTTLVPLPADPTAPPLVQDMLLAAKIAGVGPMAAVAGAIAQHVGHALERECPNVVVENGGDIYLNSKEDIAIGIFSGTSVLSGRVALRISPNQMPLGVCTSSSTVGPSLSLGYADAVCIAARDAALADAMATSVGNRVVQKKDIKQALDFALSVDNIIGAVIIFKDAIGVKGNLEIFPT
jgi:hypothetical protein